MSADGPALGLRIHKTARSGASDFGSAFGPAAEWFIFDGRGTEGPVSPEVVRARTSGQNGENLLVYRRGFSRWHRAKDVAGVLDRTAAQDVAISQETTALENQLAQVVGKFLFHRGNLSHSETLTGPGDVSARVADQRRGAKSLEPKVNAREASVRTLEVVTELLWPRDEYLIRRHLRLGVRRSPWTVLILGLMGTPFYWAFWVKRASDEGVNHLRPWGSPWNWKGLALGFMCFIPGAWAIPFGLVGMTGAQMERQNGYQRVRPWIALCLGVLPPLAMAYVQSCLTRHWQLHGIHAARAGV